MKKNRKTVGRGMYIYILHVSWQCWPSIQYKTAIGMENDGPDNDGSLQITEDRFVWDAMM